MGRILIIFSFIYLGICGETINSNDCFNYPKRIEELNSRDIYDNARWILFNWLGAKKLDGVYNGQMELMYKDVISRNDTTVVFFNFYDPSTTPKKENDLTLVANARVAFKHSTKQCIWTFLYPFEDFSDGLQAGDKLLELQLTDTTSKFLKVHRNIINNCYLELARKRNN